MSTRNTYITNEREVGLPPLQSSRKAVWDYYRIEFLPSGYPGRRTDDELFAHPIYGPYVIADYTAQYRLTKNQVFLDAACRVAEAAIEQMTRVGNGLAFVYSQDKAKVSSKKGVWYSGLTQARYIEVFNKLLAFPETDRFREPLAAILDSLLISTDDGGVARFIGNDGLIIEEYPSPAPDCTLNGWTTATCVLMDYASKNDDEQAWDIFARSVRGLERMIPIYDVPEYSNSRYKLMGSASVQVTAKGADLEVLDCQVIMPESGTFAANVEEDPAGEALRHGPATIRNGSAQIFKLSLSRMTWPAPNRILLRINAAAEGQVIVAIGDAEYNPLASAPRVHGYRSLRQASVRNGENTIEVTVPWTEAELIAHPTNFGKRIAGRQFNQYHWIHIDTLGKIVAETGSDILRYYRDKWEQYPKLWPDMSAYQDERLTLERFDPRRHK